MFTVTAPRSVELDKVLSSGDVIGKRLVSQLVERQLLNRRQLTRVGLVILATSSSRCEHTANNNNNNNNNNNTHLYSALWS